MDLFQMNKNSGIKDWKKFCMLMVDIFTKYTVITPIEGKNAHELATAIERLFDKMGKAPDMLILGPGARPAEEAGRRFNGGRRCGAHHNNDTRSGGGEADQDL
jgi:hypothetical protein